MAFSHPWLLWLLPLALLPLVFQRAHSKNYSWLDMLPADPLSDLLGLILKALAVLTLLFVVLGLSAPHTNQQQVERIGVGAQIGLVLDRSASMDDPFSGMVGTVGENKSAAAARLITQFVQSRQNDFI
jgi:mxaC protein